MWHKFITSERFPDFITLDSWFQLSDLYFIQTHARGERKHTLMQLTGFCKNKTRNYDPVFWFADGFMAISASDLCANLPSKKNYFIFLQVKIWFQNRRMKWKRSKKAQQEAKSGKETSSENANKAQTSTTKPNNTSVSQQETAENQGNARKVQEGESLYRPYVV